MTDSPNVGLFCGTYIVHNECGEQTRVSVLVVAVSEDPGAYGREQLGDKYSPLAKKG